MPVWTLIKRREMIIKKKYSVQVGRFHGEEPARNSMLTFFKYQVYNTFVTATGNRYERTS